jgi:hypothetical protein
MRGKNFENIRIIYRNSEIMVNNVQITNIKGTTKNRPTAQNMLGEFLKKKTDNNSYPTTLILGTYQQTL